MRIAIWHNLPSGGGKRALYNQIRGFLKRGHEVESWCPPTADQKYFPFGEIIPEHVMPLDWVSNEKDLSGTAWWGHIGTSCHCFARWTSTVGRALSRSMMPASTSSSS